MNREQIINIIDTHYRKINKNNKKLIIDLNDNAVHDFRVEYKKLRAFLRMISRVHHNNGEIKISYGLNKLYSITGSIRDLQLQQQRILEVTKEETKIPKAYIRLLEKEMDRLVPDLHEVYSEKPVRVSKKDTKSVIPAILPFNVFSNYVQGKWNEVFTLILSGHFIDENIHIIRKNLKDLYYNQKVYESMNIDLPAQNFWRGKDEQYYNTLLDDLGIFQDKCTAILLLKPKWIDSLNKTSRKQLEEIKSTWVKEKAALKNSLINKLRNDIVPRRMIQDA